MTTLLLRLEGPQQAWGTQSRFSDRDTGYEPSKSGVLGLICAALGRPRDHDVSDLAALRMGVRVDRPGTLEREFQTAGGGYPVLDKRGRPTGKEGNAVLSRRSYLADASFLAGLEGEEPLLRRIDEALHQPVWQLSLGRKSFVPSQRIPQGLRELPLRDALLAETRATRSSNQLLVLEVPPGAGTQTRSDIPLSFSERRYAPRHVIVEPIL